MKFKLQKILSNAGVCSRRNAEDLIKGGRVKINQKTALIGERADPDKDEIFVDEKKILYEKRLYIILNKPIGYVTTMDDVHAEKTILDLVKIKERIFPIGRLDKDSEGLLILTNDGDFANRIMHPSFEIKKTYQVKIDNELKRSDIEKLENGIIIGGKKTYPAKIKMITPNEFMITIHEGRKRIIRRMMKYFRYNVLMLRRVSIGSVKLGNLGLGEYRNMTKKEKQSLEKLSPINNT